MPGLWIATGLLLGGAIGNLIDRITNGSVTDFVKLPHWPAFNVADIGDHVRCPRAALVLEGRAGAAGAAVSDGPLELAVPEEADGMRLDRFLAEPLGSRSRAQT